MTEAERIEVEHIKANASAWRWTATEILECARHHASLDSHQLSRLPDLLQEEINKHRATKKETT
jgi:hypothetical protein